MSTTLIEKTRAAHEEIELLERAATEALLDDPKTHRDNVNQAHWIKLFADKLVERTQQLVEIYEDKNNERKDEIQMMMGNGQPFAPFYDQLKDIKTYHTKYPYLTVERPEAEQILNNLDTYETLFTGEEGYGKYLDLHRFYLRYLNLDGKRSSELPEKTTSYTDYLDIFYTFPDRNIVRNKVYEDYLNDLCEYLISFFRRSQSLFDIDATLKTFEVDFNTAWDNETFIPVGFSSEDQELESNPLYCKYSRKLFKNAAAYQGYLKGKNFTKAKKWYYSTHKLMCLLETKINRLASLLAETIDATKDLVQSKYARLPGEIIAELQEDSEVESDSEEEEVRMTKENYPVGWDGNPIPFWLYKLHGLGIEYKCEICGNMSYWGPRAFEKHFQEWRHAHGMKCLRLENTKEFHHITKIKDALELAKKLKVMQGQDVWVDDAMEECEDQEGNVMNKKTFMDLRAQGLV